MEIASSAAPTPRRVVYRGGGCPGYFLAQPVALAIDLTGGSAWAMPVAPGVDGER